MTLIPYILIAIPTCLLAIAVWTYFDYRKYKKKNSLILLLFLFYPMLLHAQYTDRNHCSIAFTSHKNQPGTLEQVKDNMIFQFIPNNDFWKIIIKNNNSEDAQINWEKASFIINGRASGISLQPHSTESNSMDIIKNNSEITRTVTASKLIAENKINRIYDKQDLKKGGKTSVSITLPIGISLQPHSTESNSMDIIKNNSEITRTVTASKLIAENKINRIYDKQDLKKGGKTSVSITLPIGVGDKPQFFHIFNFIVTQDN